MFTKLPGEHIDNFKDLAEQFTARFITNSLVVKSPDALTHLMKERNVTIREYSSRYWEVFQEAEDCDMKFAVSTFKYGLPWDINGI